MAEPNPDDKQKNEKLTLRQRLKNAFNGVTRKDLKGALADTLMDLRKPKEIGIFIVSSIVPGGWIGYAAYRITKYKLKHKPANDNLPPPQAGADITPPKQDKKPPSAPKP